jgi:CCR4-NOT transcription complex subunit 1
MLHFLFDEYKFFQSYYPARELAMTGYLFGSLIGHHLVDFIPLGIAIRYIMDAVSCPPETNLFKFGVQALTRFQSRLGEWQPLCHTLINNSALMEGYPELAASIHRAVAAGGGVVPAALDIPSAAELLPLFTAIHPDPIDSAVVEPPEEISDRILFIVNNLAPSNFEAKVDDMRQHFDDAYARWFARYLVDQRISIEPNNHGLYLRFLNALGRKSLATYVLHETYVKSAGMLNSEKSFKTSSERTILKNIGSWLGSITLARDRPIKFKNMSLKDLLIEGFENGRLIVAIPFVCKALEPCARSRIFKPPNPWLMAVLGLLAELYHFADLKLNLKFEIEVLCKDLDVDLDSVEISSVLRNRPLEQLAGPGLPTYLGDMDSLPMGGFDPLMPMHDGQVLGLGPSGAGDSQRAIAAHIEAILSSVTFDAVINPQLGPAASNPALKRAVQLALDRAIREVSCPMHINYIILTTSTPDHSAGGRARLHDCRHHDT